ncbi:MAG TPA: hypothetical protein VI306_11510 [Pyrinomonadaceae bacterium]
MRFIEQWSGKWSGKWSRIHAQGGDKVSDFFTESVYHRGGIDQQLIEDLLGLIEKRLHSLTVQSNWCLTLYILYSQADSFTFGRWESRRELKKGLVEHYRNVVKATPTAGQNIGRQGLEAFGYSLWSPSLESPIQCRLKDYDEFGGYVDLDLYLAEDNSSLTAKGRLSTLVRALPIIRDQEIVLGGLEFDGNIAISPHIEMSQRGTRGERNLIYLTRPDVPVVLGPHVGCDLYVPSLDRVAIFTAGNDELKIDKPLRSLNRLSENEWQGSDFRLKCLTSEEIGVSTSFGEMLEKREATRSARLQVIARVLPRPKGEGPHGYGLDWCELSSQVSRNVKVSLRLDVHSSIGIDSDDQLFVWLNTQRRFIEIGERGDFQVNERKFRWEPDETGVFYGSVYFEDSDSLLIETRTEHLSLDKETTWLVSRGPHPEFASLLGRYTEDGLISRRGSIMIHSSLSGTIEISLTNNKSGHLFFRESGNWHATRQSTVDQKSLGTFVGQEFIFGSSRYRLTRQGKPYRKEKHWSGTFDLIRAS